ncbi:hypothetical protein GCM10018773_56290 [Streptomyces candidus]|nr:hypothetical protein GCM10018773_56290 [Streptomyces candidus]
MQVDAHDADSRGGTGRRDEVKGNGDSNGLCAGRRPGGGGGRGRRVGPLGGGLGYALGTAGRAGGDGRGAGPRRQD